ncbi:Crp/Fnr family transcriptional regulator [Merismopedia glauca]|uniref:Crp/Fnr family transcriptional regulator n=1 Tax=Merismopedia glauca CCAP 1448/3 TaxID=1296344 RepID=A0A2T1C587_9CYAN|nr:Crp/Fnr family transcriptional regulator [Merismopedia glauca]PSB03307.1 Crp/Fnr family transcriptional regulator [Merismopedia glauca CCAP 1448/3]
MSTVLPSQTLGTALYQENFSLRSPLPLKNNYLWKIETGVVRTFTWLEDGTLVTTGLWGPGDLVGKALSTLDPYQIESLTHVQASLLPLENEQIRSEWLLNHLQQIEALIVIRSYRRVDMMLVKLLVWLGKRFGRAVETGNLIDLRLTHHDLAEMLGTTRVTVTRILGKLEEQGLIQRLQLQRIVLKEDELWHYEI